MKNSHEARGHLLVGVTNSWFWFEPAPHRLNVLGCDGNAVYFCIMGRLRCVHLSRNHPRHARVDGPCVRRLDPLVGVESRKGETNDDEEGKEAPDATGTEKGEEDSSGIASPTFRFAAVACFSCNETRSCDSMGVRPANVESGTAFVSAPGSSSYCVYCAPLNASLAPQYLPPSLP